MSGMTFERILEAARALSPEQQQKLIALLSQGSAMREARLAAIHRARGSMTDLLPSTESFLADKRAEIDLNDSNLQRIKRIRFDSDRRLHFLIFALTDMNKRT